MPGSDTSSSDDESQAPYGGAPLTGKQNRRLFESLLLLEVLNGPVQGDRISASNDSTVNSEASRAVDQRRLLLKQLCMACDFDKGGETCTAMAMAKTRFGPEFWVASNKNTPGTIQFLQNVFDLVNLFIAAGIENCSEIALAESLFKVFTEYANKRLRKTFKLLRKAISSELEFLRSSGAASDDRAEYRVLLERLHGAALSNTTDMMEICRACHQAIDSPLLKLRHQRELLRERAIDPSSDFNVRHFVGRMASTRKAADDIAHVARLQPDLFNYHGFFICKCGPPRPGPPVQSDRDLSHIASRLLPSHRQGDHWELSQRLQQLNQEHDLMHRVSRKSTEPNFKLKVHAELAVLEAVFTANIEFYDNDKYIACSKPACFCCHQYICAHPGQFVRPASHNKLWLNWRPPDLSNPNDRVQVERQHNVMVKVINQVRELAVAAIMSPRSEISSPRRTDSTSGGPTTTYGLPSVVDNLRALNMTHPSDDRIQQFLSLLEDSPSRFADHVSVPEDAMLDSVSLDTAVRPTLARNRHRMENVKPLATVAETREISGTDNSETDDEEHGGGVLLSALPTMIREAWPVISDESEEE